MTFRTLAPTTVLLSGLALPQVCKVGLLEAAHSVACPTSLPNIAQRTHERSVSHHAPLARMRFFSFLSLHEKKLKEVGQ